MYNVNFAEVAVVGSVYAVVVSVMFDFKAALAVEMPAASSCASVFESTAPLEARTIIDTEPETDEPGRRTSTVVRTDAAVVMDPVTP